MVLFLWRTLTDTELYSISGPTSWICIFWTKRRSHELRSLFMLENHGSKTMLYTWEDPWRKPEHTSSFLPCLVMHTWGTTILDAFPISFFFFLLHFKYVIVFVLQAGSHKSTSIFWQIFMIEIRFFFCYMNHNLWQYDIYFGM